MPRNAHSAERRRRVEQRPTLLYEDRGDRRVRVEDQHVLRVDLRERLVQRPGLDVTVPVDG